MTSVPVHTYKKKKIKRKSLPNKLITPPSQYQKCKICTRFSVLLLRVPVPSRFRGRRSGGSPGRLLGPGRRFGTTLRLGACVPPLQLPSGARALGFRWNSALGLTSLNLWITNHHVHNRIVSLTLRYGLGNDWGAMAGRGRADCGCKQPPTAPFYKKTSAGAPLDPRTN